MTTGTENIQIAQAAEQTRELYPLDEMYTEVEIKVGKVSLLHRLRRPTLDELRRHEAARELWQVQVNEDESELIVEKADADRNLWNEIAVAVRNYDSADWRDVTDTLRSAIPASHKEKAIEALYSIETTFAGASYVDEDAGVFRLEGAAEVHVTQVIHGFTIDHYLRRPTEGEWSRFMSRAWKTREKRESKKTRMRILTDMTAGIALYDALLLRMSGVSLAGEPYSDARRSDFIAAFDPLLASLVASALRDKINPKLGN